MIPKTELRYSLIYNIQFNQDFDKKDLSDLKNKCKNFEKLYTKYIKKLLQKIEKYSGKWKREYIPIYIVESNQKSFSDPLTLKFHQDANLMFVTLAHELLHNNLKIKWSTRKELHQFMEPLLNKIVIELNKNFESALDELNNIIYKVYNF
ncbi:MAG: hypothetical protein QXP53_01180 [Candidatus Pacearchaeota archaeon]